MLVYTQTSVLERLLCSGLTGETGPTRVLFGSQPLGVTACVRDEIRFLRETASSCGRYTMNLYDQPYLGFDTQKSSHPIETTSIANHNINNNNHDTEFHQYIIQGNKHAQCTSQTRLAFQRNLCITPAVWLVPQVYIGTVTQISNFVP